MTKQFEKITTELKIARQVYADIKELNDFEPCPQARAVLQEVIDRYNSIAAEDLNETIYIVREMSKSDDPADVGTELKRFKGEDGWSKAAAYRDALYTEDNIKSYVSPKR